RDFTASFTDLPRAPAGLEQLKLVPRKDDPEYEWIGIGVDPSSLQIRYLVAVDKQGGRSAFTFSNLKENRGLTDNIFDFRIPRGVEVITNGARTPPPRSQARSADRPSRPRMCCIPAGSARRHGRAGRRLRDDARVDQGEGR